MKLKHNRYFDYQELTQVLEQFAQSFPQLVTKTSLGKTTSGADIWLMTVTDFASGADSEKPAMWIDGNTHATELAGCQACVHLIDTLTSQAGSEPRITALLKKTAFYVIPRISVDGAEAALKNGRHFRSSPEIFPNYVPPENFVEKDLDGDNQILKMRVIDPSGMFKVSKKDPRLMIIREPTDFMHEDGPFYHLYPEGVFENFDGYTKNFVEAQKFDLNRQSPAQFSPSELGAGPLPLYLTEGQIIARAFVARPNICGAHTHHTFGGVLLRPSSLRADSELPLLDLEIFKAMGKLGEAATGYKAHSVFHDFKYNPKKAITGAWDDWHFDHRGVFSWTPEIWNIAAQAGVKLEKPLEIYQNLGEESFLKILSWCDQTLKGVDFYKPWTKFQHPQLGDVEIGGWRSLFTWSNPPHQLLEAELEKLTRFTLKQAEMSPQLAIKSIKTERLNNNLFSVKVVIQNVGFLPTYISETAQSLKIYPKPVITLKPAASQKIIEGKAEFQVEHLAGRAESLPWNSPNWGDGPSNDRETQLSWLIAGEGTAHLSAAFGAGGKIRNDIKLG